MNIRIVDTKTGPTAIVNSDTVIISDGLSALEFASNIFYEHNCRKIAVNKAAICKDFFKLSTGFAGEIAQKFVNYHYHVAIIGDFSVYISKPLHDYIYEINKGKHLCFVESEEEALKKLGEA